MNRNIKLVSTEENQYTSNSKAYIIYYDDRVSYVEKSKLFQVLKTVENPDDFEIVDTKELEYDLDFEHVFLKRDYNGYSLDRSEGIIKTEVKFGVEALCINFDNDSDCESFLKEIHNWAMKKG